MPLNTSLYPPIYTNICPTQAGEEPLEELRRQLLVVRNQLIASQRIAGQNTAELQNQVLTNEFQELVTGSAPPNRPARPPAILRPPIGSGSPKPQPKPAETPSRRKSYFGGGFRGTFHGQIERINHNSASLASLSWALDTPRLLHAGISSARRGYWLGGQATQNGAGIATVEVIRFLSETKVAFSNTLTAGLKGCRGTYGRRYGLTAGGIGPSSGLINVMDFRTEAITAAAAALTTVRGRNNNNQSSTHGYYSGGAGDVTAIEKVQFSDQAVSTASTTLNSPRVHGATINSDRAGYIFSGITESPLAGLLTVQRIRFSNDATAILSESLGFSSSQNEGVSDRRFGLFSVNRLGSQQMLRFNFGSESVQLTSAVLQNGGRSPTPTTKG